MQKFYRVSVVLVAFALLLGSSCTALAQTEVPNFQLGGSPFGGGGDENPVTLQAEFTQSQGTTPARLSITATIKAGWHIYSITQAAGGPIKTEIKLSPSNQYKVRGDFKADPKPNVEQKPAEFPGIDIETHDDKVTWSAPIELASGVEPSDIKIEGTVSFQSCQADSCRAPQSVPFAATLTKGESKPRPVAPATDKDSLWIHLGWAFLGGLILNLMPCVLPVISLKLFSFLKQGGESRLRVFGLNLCYSAGLLAVFMVLAALAAGAGLSWGEQFTKAWFKVAMTGLVFAMGLSFLGVWEIPIPGFVGSGRAVELQQKEGAAGAFFKGVFTTILATPCSGPFLGPVFGYLLKQPPHTAYIIFGGVGLGMASPYLVIGAFPKLIGFLPKPGAWMKTLEELMGFLMLATVIYLLTTLSSPYFIPTLTLLLGLWFACWLIGRTSITAGPAKRLAAWATGLGAAALVGWFAFTILFWQPLIKWEHYSPDALAKARAEGKTVMVDFSAEWCLTCKTNIRWSIDTAKVRDLLKTNRVVPMLADWTDESPEIKQALNDLGRNSIPVLAIWPAGGSDEAVIVQSDLLSQADVLAALEQAGPSK